MDVTKASLQLIDFSDLDNWRWIIRRVVIGFLLTLFYSYAVAFGVMVMFTPEPIVPLMPSPFLVVKDNHLITMATFGFLGSVFFVTRTFIVTQNKADYPVAWYLTRPLQGVLMAIFIYFAFRAGQFVFYSGEGQVDEKAINVYTLSILAIVTGMFTEQAYGKLCTIANNFFKSEKKEN